MCAPKGTPVYPVAEGVVARVGDSKRGDSWRGAGYGNYIVVKYAGGFQTHMAHFISKPSLAVGQRVGKDTVLGKIGWSGKTSFGPHVHVAFKRSANYADLRAEKFLGEYRRLLAYCLKCNVK